MEHVEHTHDIAAALNRLDSTLPLSAPWLTSTLRPPASEEDLHALREAVAPWPLPTDLYSYLRWHDGQSDKHTTECWPTLNAGLLTPIQHMIRNYKSFCSDGFMGPWPPGWLPLTQEGWYATALELTVDRPGVLIDVNIDGRRLIAPSLAAMFHATADLAVERSLLSAAERAPQGEAVSTYQATLERATSRRYEGAWQHWRSVEEEHGVSGRQDKHGYLPHLEDPAFYRQIGWSGPATGQAHRNSSQP